MIEEEIKEGKTRMSAIIVGSLDTGKISYLFLGQEIAELIQDKMTEESKLEL